MHQNKKNIREEPHENAVYNTPLATELKEIDFDWFCILVLSYEKYDSRMTNYDLNSLVEFKIDLLILIGGKHEKSF